MFCPTGSALPTPVSLGYYSTGPSPIEKDDPERRTGQKKCPAGSFCEMGIKRTCPPGVFGATAGLQNASCTDVCPKGYYCPEGSVNGTLRRCPSGRYGTSEGLTDRACTGRCHEGYYCPEGSTSPTQHQCSQPVPTTRYWTPDTTAEGRTSAPPPEELQTPPRSDAVFCPLGSAVPTVVLPGHYSLGQDRHTRTGQARCPPGSFCRAGIIYDCPPGRYGKAWELASAECTGPCARGYYCPVGSTESTQVACPAGRYGAVEGLGSIACSGACPRPSHCPQASVLKVRASTESRPDIF